MRYLNLLVICCFPVFLQATTYYLDPLGNSGTDGLSPATAFHRLSRLLTVTPMPGDTFKFIRGGEWREPLTITAQGTAAQPIVYTTYGDTTLPRPIISGLSELLGLGNPANWFQTGGGNLWSTNLDFFPGRLFAGEEELLRTPFPGEYAVIETIDGQTGHWSYYFNERRLEICAPDNPALVWGYFQGNPEFYTSFVVNARHLVFTDLDFQGAQGASLTVNGVDSVLFQRCSFGAASGGGLHLSTSRTIFQGEVTIAPTRNVRIEDCVFDPDYPFTYFTEENVGIDGGLLLRDGVMETTVARCTLRNWEGSAIELLSVNDHDSLGVTKNVIRDNYILAPDLLYARPFSVGGFAGQCDSNRLRRNVIDSVSFGSRINGNANTFDHNIIREVNRQGRDEKDAYGILADINDAGLVSNNNRYEHNLIIDTDGAGIRLSNFEGEGVVSGHVFRNNLLYRTGRNPRSGDYNDGTALFIDDADPERVKDNVFANNLFFSDLPAAKPVFSNFNFAYWTAAEFNARDGENGNAIRANLEGDPLFTDFAAGDYLPTLGSPAVNRGEDTGLAFDFALMPRLQGPAPDIGPLETDIILPLSWGEFRLEARAKNQVRLHWTTLQEENTADFLVERRTDNTPWRSIGRQTAAGSSNASVTYSFDDENPPSGLIYYRLQQRDTDGAEGFSPVRTITLLGEKARIKAVLPGELRLSFPADFVAEGLQIRVFDVARRQVQSQLNGHAVELPAALPTGVYYLYLKPRGGVGVTLPFVYTW